MLNPLLLWFSLRTGQRGHQEAGELVRTGEDGDNVLVAKVPLAGAGD